MNLRLARKEKGYTQEDLAQRLGVSQNYLSQIEAGNRAITERVRIGLAELGIFVSEVQEEKKTVSLTFIDIGISAGTGILNLSDFPQISSIDVSIALLNIPARELEGCYLMAARGNSMSPVIDNGDRMVVKNLTHAPTYLEGTFIVNYDGELYVKTIQLDHNQLIMKSINPDFKDIVIDLEKNETHLQIIAKVLAIVKNR